jgi:dCMP deaminase
MKPAIYRDLIDDAYRVLVEAGPKAIDLRDIFMNLAFMLSLKSTCRRGKAGCVVVKDSRIISVGYNGVPTRMTECIQREQCRQQGSIVKLSLNIWEPSMDVEIKSDGCFDSLHAETNALGFCLRNGIDTSGSFVFLTMSPCKSCAQLMIAAGVKRVYYRDFSRTMDGLAYLKTYGAEAIQLKAVNLKGELVC